MAELLANAFRRKGFRWDTQKARHLLNRAGFGIPPSAVTRLAALSPEEAVRSFLDYEKFPEPNAPPDWLPEALDFPTLRARTQGMTEEQRQQFRRERERANRDALLRLQRWWFDRICRTQRPLEEKMTLFWHSHFAVSAQKVRSARLNYQLNATLRRHATGSFRTLLKEVAKSPAMLEYLDNRQNVKGNPNENWAREFFELFTLGIGNYTEADIKEAARAFTGWTARGEQPVFVARRHDDGVKTIFGRTGRFTGDDVIELTLAQPACAEFICAKFWRFFAYEDPEPEVVRGLAETFRSSNYELKPVLQQMFSSQAFYSERAIATQIKSPVQYLAQLVVQLDLTLPERPPLVQFAMRAMGQELFHPPNVKGWDGGKRWINTSTLLVRQNFATYLVAGGRPDVIGNRRLGQGGGRHALLAAASSPEQRMEEGQSGNGVGTMMEEQIMTSDPSEARFVPAGQDAMLTDIPTQTLARALAQQGRGERRFPPPADARKVFRNLDGGTPEQIVQALAQHFLARSLDSQQVQVLTGLLAPQHLRSTPLKLTEVPLTNLQATLQALLCTAEYQLC